MLTLNLEKFSDLQKRIMSSFVMIAFLGLIFWGGVWPLKILTLFLVGALSFEWAKICKFSLKVSPFLTMMLICAAVYATSVSRSTLGVGVLLCLASLGVFLSWLSWYRRFLWFTLGLLYIGLPCLSIFWMLDHLQDGILILAWVIVISALNDMTAYFIGTWLRGPKLMEAISPSKTWSGFFGGLICSSLAGGLFYFFIQSNISLQQFMGLCAIIAFFSTVGDLCESKIKRFHKIKDSGDIIPGHGGLFDRLDGFLFVMPFVTLAIFLWPQIMLFSWK
jgi:phosphatidate cytidylyltransferase